MKKLFLCLGVSVLFFSLTACTTYPIHMVFRGSSTLNLDKYSRSLPVEIYIYQLRDNNRFVNAGFYELWRQSAAVLGDTLISKRSIVLNPGEEKVLKINRRKRANFIGVIAIFRKPFLRDFRVCQSLPRGVPYVPTKIVLGLMGNRIYVK